MENLKYRIKELRTALNINQEELGKKLNVTKQTISGWETGYRIPDILTLNALANLFNCTVDYLIGRTDTKNSKVDTTDLDNHDYKIELDKGIETKITQDELREMIRKLKAVGFDVNKLLDKEKENDNN